MIKGMVPFTGFILLLWIIPRIFSLPDPEQRFAPLQPPSWEHPFGTNDLGQDLFTEFFHAGKTAVTFALGVGMVAGILGFLLGGIAGYSGGWVEEGILGIGEILLLIPRLPFLIALGAFLRPSFPLVSFLLGFLFWPAIARVVRSKVLQIRSLPFIASNRLFGFSRMYILFTDLLLNLAYAAFPQVLLTLSSAFQIEASLSFLGLFDPSVRSWGATLRWAFQKGGFITGRYWWFVPPAMGIFLAVYSISQWETFLPKYDERMQE